MIGGFSTKFSLEVFKKDDLQNLTMQKTIVLSKDSFISKKEFVMLQGIAVSLMVWHHLFAFPERISVPYVLVADSLAHMETLLSYFGRICIAVFAFCSGYGMHKKATDLSKSVFCRIANDYREVVRRLFRFYQKYWAVFLVFVPLGFFLKVYSFRLIPFLKGLVGLSSVYNAEWWYVEVYIALLLLFPLLRVLDSFMETQCPALRHILILAFLMILLWGPDSFRQNNFLYVLCYFVEGMYFIRTNIWEWIYERIHLEWLRVVVGVALLMAVFALRTLGMPDFLLVSFFVFGVMLLLKNKIVLRAVGSLLRIVGKYSTYIWLTHTFFAYYYFQEFTYFPRYSWLTAAFCMVLCIGCGAILEWILKAFGRIGKKLCDCQSDMCQT